MDSKGALESIRAMIAPGGKNRGDVRREPRQAKNNEPAQVVEQHKKFRNPRKGKR